MKRLLTVILALMMLPAVGNASAAGFGLLSTPAPQATEQIPAFTFRNGIGWNMSTEQVSTLETAPMNERTSGDWSVMMTAEKVAVSRFAADLVFIFRQNQLRMITYEFNYNNDSVISFYYLIGALEFKYGKSQDAEPQIVKNLMDGWSSVCLIFGAAGLKAMCLPRSLNTSYIPPGPAVRPIIRKDFITCTVLTAMVLSPGHGKKHLVIRWIPWMLCS